jgi:hypothetical protein
LVFGGQAGGKADGPTFFGIVNLQNKASGGRVAFLWWM